MVPISVNTACGSAASIVMVSYSPLHIIGAAGLDDLAAGAKLVQLGEPFAVRLEPREADRDAVVTIGIVSAAGSG